MGSKDAGHWSVLSNTGSERIARERGPLLGDKVRVTQTCLFVRTGL